MYLLIGLLIFTFENSNHHIKVINASYSSSCDYIGCLDSHQTCEDVFYLLESGCCYHVCSRWCLLL